MQSDVMTIRGKDHAARYEVCGEGVRDMRMRFCQHPETEPGTVCPRCSLHKSDTIQPPAPGDSTEVITEQL
jgi:hypothetical protein